MGDFAVSSLCSLPFQGSLALGVLVITLATYVLLAGETELSSPHPLWVLFPTSLPAGGRLTGEPGCLPFQGEAEGSLGYPVLGATVADSWLPFFYSVSLPAPFSLDILGQDWPCNRWRPVSSSSGPHSLP